MKKEETAKLINTLKNGESVLLNAEIVSDFRDGMTGFKIAASEKVIVQNSKGHKLEMKAVGFFGKKYVVLGVKNADSFDGALKLLKVLFGF